MVNIGSLLKTMPFSRLDKWYVECYLNPHKLNSKYNTAKLQSLITPIKRRIKKSDYDGKLPIVSKIMFKTGEIFFREKNRTGMDLLRVMEGDILISSINFHQGATALNDIGEFACSTHYQTFLVDNERAIPAFLVRVLRSPIFLNMVSGLKANGIKNESGFGFIGEFEIPLPTIQEQKTILQKYYSGLAEANGHDAKGNDTTSEILHGIQSWVTSNAEKKHDSLSTGKILKTVPLSSARRWEVDYIFKEGTLNALYETFKYPGCSLGKLQTESLFGLSNKASLTCGENMIPVLRMSNITEGKIDCSELKYLPYSDAAADGNPNKWLLRDGDLLVTRTNGSADLVGKAAVFHLPGTYTYASYLIRYRFDTSIILPDYISILMMTPIVRKQISVMRRQGGGQYNLNSDEIGAIRIPVPPVGLQKNIIKKIQRRHKHGETIP